MLLESGGIGVTTALPNVSDSDNSRTNSTYFGVTPTSSGAKFTIVVANGKIDSITPTAAGKGYKVGDTIIFSKEDIGGTEDYEYTIPDGIINQRFAMGEVITSTLGAGSGAGGIGGTAVVTISGNTKIGAITTSTSQSNGDQNVIAVTSVTGLTVGMTVASSTPGLPANAAITSISNSNVTINANITESMQSGTTFTFGGGGINSIQRAILNESLASPTEVPLEEDDKIQILYTINSRTGQRNAADQFISVIYKTIFEFELD